MTASSRLCSMQVSPFEISGPLALMNRKLSVTLVALSIGVGGCSTSMLESKKIDYKSAKQVSTLEVPPDLTAPSRDDRYSVPDISPRGVATYSDYSTDRAAQPQVSAGPEVLPASNNNIRIERAGAQRWLVIPGTPEKLWPDIKDFWIETGFILNIDRPDIGVMETDWAEDRAKIPQDWLRSTIGRVFDGLWSTSVRDKFRTRLEEGKEPGTVEVFISHRGVEEVFTSQTQERTSWQPRPSDPELEAEMMRRLMVRLGVEQTRAAEIVDTEPVSDRARLTTAGSGVKLEVDESFDRAWRRVGLALDRLGFAVEDRDRAQGLYFVRYIDPDAGTNEESSGFLSSLAFWRSSNDVAERGSEYRIRVVGEGDLSRVTVLTREGGDDVSETATRILTVLYEQLR